MFKIGDKIVYPMHGAGVIEKLETKEILGEKREYFIIKMPIGDMKVMVPVSNVEEVGVREIISPDEIEDIMSILRGHKTKMPQNWNRRYRINMDRMFWLRVTPTRTSRSLLTGKSWRMRVLMRMEMTQRSKLILALECQ
jgi:RNA polymerase-interacting CarD/CdnL/TRCF family regulator